MKVQYHVSSSDLTDVEDVGGWVKKFTDSELDSDERQGTTSGLRWWYERLRCRVMAAYVATPSHEKTYPSGCASGYFTVPFRRELLRRKKAEEMRVCRSGSDTME